MSSSTPGETSTPSSEFKSTLDSALIEYKKTTGRELLEHPLAAEVKRCDSVDAISAILRRQARDFRRFNDSDQKLMRGIDPIVGVLWTFSGTLEGVSSMALPPAGAIFIGIGVLLAEAKDVNRSHNALIELFERIENVFKPLSDYTQISSNTEVTELFSKTAAEVLSILSIATKEVVRKRAKIYFGKLLGRKDIEDAFKRLDGLIQEQIRMVIDQTLKATIENKDEINQASDKIDNISYRTGGSKVVLSTGPVGKSQHCL
ncbi:hypothetical protein EI94DRAFT_1790034 [Lactarius quietus]|nr:hypothetical protein EI94DRAFT_1790034 [Lactarius quietus]